MRFHVRGVDHLCVCGSSVSSKLPEQVFPDATPRPAHKAIIDRCRRSILGRAIAPATAAFQNMHDAADDAAVVRPLDAPYIRRQMRFDPSPLLVAQPKQVPAHNPDPLPTTNQDRIVRAKKLMSSDPNQLPGRPSPVRRCRARRSGRLLPVGGQRLAVSSAATSSAVSFRFAAVAKLSTCVTLVALAIGAVTPSRAMSQASAISAGLA